MPGMVARRRLTSLARCHARMWQASVQFEDPSSPAEWLRLVAQHERRARSAAADKKLCAHAWSDLGIAVECMRKAIIMHTNRFNAWPSKNMRPDLHTHNIRQLAKIAGIEITTRDRVAAAWVTRPRLAARALLQCQTNAPQSGPIHGRGGLRRARGDTMAEKPISAERIAAGREFFLALKELGVYPDGLFWAFDEQIEEQVLVPITSLFDYVGPFRFNKLLIKAYNAAATPQSISPFIIRLHSPNDDMAVAILKLCRELRKGIFIRGSDSDTTAGWVLGSEPTGPAECR